MTRITVDFPFVHVTNPITGRNAALSTCYFGVPDGDPYNNAADRVPVYAVQPDGAAQKLDALAVISRGMAKATSDKVATGVVNSLLDDKAGFLRRMVGSTGSKAARLLPVVGEIAGSAITEIANAGTKRSAAAGEILASPEFTYLIRRGVAEGVVTGNKASKALQQAEQKFMKSKKYKAWADTLSSEELQAISSVGLASFLTSQNQEGK